MSKILFSTSSVDEVIIICSNIFQDSARSNSANHSNALLAVCVFCIKMISSINQKNISSTSELCQKSFLIDLLKSLISDIEDIWNSNVYSRLVLKQVFLPGLMHCLRVELNNKQKFEALLGIVYTLTTSNVYQTIAKRELYMILEFITVLWRFVSTQSCQHQSILFFFDDLIDSFERMISLFRPHNSELLPNILQG
jgi:hypothetical protein